MKDRLKKFYKDHEEACLVGLFSVAGLAVIGIVSKQRIDAITPTNVMLSKDDQVGDIVHILLKNGMNRAYTFDIPKEG